MMPDFALPGLITSLAALLSDEVLALTAAVCTQLGDTLATIGTQRALCAQLPQRQNPPPRAPNKNMVLGNLPETMFFIDPVILPRPPSPAPTHAE